MSKKNYILAVLLMCLLLAVYYYRVPYQARQAANQTKHNPFKDLELTKIDKIMVTYNNKTTELIKNQNVWQITNSDGFNANQDMVNALIASLAQSVSSSISIASNNEATKTVYETDQKQGKNLQLWQADNKIVEVVVGKGQPGMSYIALPKESQSLQLMNDLASVLGGSEWRDLKIYNGDPSTALSLTVMDNLKSNNELKIIKEKEQWFSADKKILLNKDKVNTLLNPMTNLYASGIPEQNLAVAGLDKPVMTVTLSSSNYKHILLIGKTQGDSYFVKSADSSRVYLVNKGSVDVFKTELKKLQ